MSYTRYFLVPNYYTKFSCKCGDCRSTCCGGWGIPISMEEYFSLIGRDCSPELRHRLDTAFHLADDRSPEHYAMVTPRFDGGCRLQAENGLCMLQRECGGDAIPTVCRYYPRAPRLNPFPECCTSASCEKTLELLFENNDPVEFVSAELTFNLPEPAPTDISTDDYITTRLEAFAILGDRSTNFEARVLRLAQRLYNKEDFCPKSSGKVDFLPIVLDFLSGLERTSMTIQAILPEIREFYSSEHGTGSLSTIVDDLDVKLEKLFVNNLFYKSFPNSFVSSENHLAEEAMAICMAAAVTKVAAAAYLSAHNDEASRKTAFIDIIAQVFRVIEHSRFDECAVAFLRKIGAVSLNDLEKLLNI